MLVRIKVHKGGRYGTSKSGRTFIAFTNMMMMMMMYEADARLAAKPWSILNFPSVP